MFSFRSVYQRVTRQYRELMGLPALDGFKESWIPWSILKKNQPDIDEDEPDRYEFDERILDDPRHDLCRHGRFEE